MERKKQFKSQKYFRKSLNYLKKYYNLLKQ